MNDRNDAFDRTADDADSPITFAKIATAAVWTWGALAVIAPDWIPRSTAGQAAFWLLVLVHAVEALIFTRVAERARGSVIINLSRIFAFGMFAVEELRARQPHSAA